MSLYSDSPRPLPAARPGAPSRDRSAAAVRERAWVPTVPSLPEGGAAAEELYVGRPKPYIVRALSPVPGELRQTALYDRLALRSGARIDGPAILEQTDATAFVDPGLTAEIDRFGNAVIAPTHR